MRGSETEKLSQQKLQTVAKWRRKSGGSRNTQRERERGKCAKMFQFKLIIVCATSGAAKKRQAEA